MADDKAKNYVVVAHGVLVNCDGGFSTLVLRGGPLPPNADKDQVAHMLDLGLVEEREFVGGLEPLRTGDGQEQVTSRYGASKSRSRSAKSDS